MFLQRPFLQICSGSQIGWFKMVSLSHWFLATQDVVFFYNIGNGDENLTVHSEMPFNDNEWHEVKAEMNVKLTRLRVDRIPWVVRAAPPQTFIHLNLTKNLTVGKWAYVGLRACLCVSNAKQSCGKHTWTNIPPFFFACLLTYFGLF